jgi:uncharacterized membrane protein YbhN (UPF0104 family)
VPVAIRFALVVVAVVLAIVALPGLGGVRQRLSHADTGDVLACAGLQVLSVISFAMAFHAAFGRALGRVRAASLALLGQGINVLVPAGGSGGLAAAAAILVRLGMPRDLVICRMLALFLISAGLTNILIIIAGGFGVAAGVLPGHVPLAEALVPAAGATVVCGLAVALARRARPEPRAQAGRFARMVRGGIDHLVTALRAGGGLLRAGDPLLLLGAFGYIAFDLAALGGSVRAVSATGIPLGALLLSYTLGQIGSVVTLPGMTEGGLLGVLVMYGTPLGTAASAVVVFRAVQIAIPLALGLVGAAGVRAILADDLTLVAVPGASTVERGAL